jgi:hypothetical protein
LRLRRGLLDRVGQLCDVEEVPARHVSDVHDAEVRQTVGLAARREREIAHDDEFVRFDDHS